MQRKTSIRIKAQEAGGRALDYIAGRFTYRSREEWCQEIDSGRFLNKCGQRITARTVLAEGDRLVYLMPEMNEPPVDCNFTVIYEDKDLLVVNKPGRLPCHPGGRFFQHTLWALLREKAELARPSLINRLDRETSGLVLVAKHRQAARHCHQQFAEKRVEKIYQVLVEGNFPAGRLTARGFLASDQESVIRKKVRFYPEDFAPQGAKECCTHFKRLQHKNGISLLEARPRTGRCHQIRATLYSLGYPVVGDKLYGVDEQLFLRFQQDILTEEDRQRLRLDRQALHAEQLTITHPSNGRIFKFSSPMPEALQALILNQ